MNEQLWCYVRSGQRLGPFPFAHLQTMVATGTLGPTDLVWPNDRPEAAAPATMWPGLFSPAAPTAPPTDGRSERPLWLRVADRVWDAAGGILQLAASIVGGIILLAIFVNIFCGKGPQVSPSTKPAAKSLPVEVRFRASAVGKGMVLHVKNASDRPLVDLGITITAAGGEKAGRIVRGMKRPLEPGQEVEIGWAELDGWQLSPGEKVELWLPEPGYEPVVVTVPAKATVR